MDTLSVIELDTPPDDFLSNEPEGAAFHNAFQRAAIENFECRYLAVFRNGQRVAVAPYFLHTFSLSTMLPDGLLKKALAWIKFRIACVGHPSTDFGRIEGERSADILALINATLAKKAALVAWKGFPESLPVSGFFTARGLPVSVLTIRGDYYSQLDAHRRNDFRHKLKTASRLRTETCSTLPEALLQPVYRLYLDTLKQAKVRFEVLTPDYFRTVSGLGTFHLYFEDERLIGFLQILSSGNKANLKYMGMDHIRKRHYYLYFAMCLRAIESCIAAGCTDIELGTSSYQAKRLMGCEEIETRIYFRHNNALTNWLLGHCIFLLEPSRDELR